CCAVLEELGQADPLLRELAEPASDHFQDEDGCRHALERFAEIPREGAPGNPGARQGAGQAAGFAPRPLTGRLGAYEVLDLRGGGGMGAVYRARHAHLKRLVALKTLPADCLGDTRALERFRREIETVARLDHPNIVRASDAGEEGDILYLVMDY